MPFLPLVINMRGQPTIIFLGVLIWFGPYYVTHELRDLELPYVKVDSVIHAYAITR